MLYVRYVCCMSVSCVLYVCSMCAVCVLYECVMCAVCVQYVWARARVCGGRGVGCMCVQKHMCLHVY